MLTGRPAFSGATVTDTLGAILEREPPWDALPMATPAAVRRLLRRCFEKDSRVRLHDIADARIEIDEALLPSPTDQTKHGWPKKWVAAAVMLVVVLGVGACLAPAPPGHRWARASSPDQPARERPVLCTRRRERRSQFSVVSRCQDGRLRRNGGPQVRAVVAIPRWHNGPNAARNRGRQAAVLVDRREVYCLLRKRKTAANRCGWWDGIGCLRRSYGCGGCVDG